MTFSDPAHPDPAPLAPITEQDVESWAVAYECAADEAVEWAQLLYEEEQAEKALAGQAAASTALTPVATEDTDPAGEAAFADFPADEPAPALDEPSEAPDELLAPAAASSDAGVSPALTSVGWARPTFSAETTPLAESLPPEFDSTETDAISEIDNIADDSAIDDTDDDTDETEYVEAEEDEESPEPLLAGGGGAWTIPLLCAGIALIASCLLLSQTESNRKLVWEREKLKTELRQVQKQASVNQEFLDKVAGDHGLAQRLAQRQMKLVPTGTAVLTLHGASNTTQSPFTLTAVPPPDPTPPYQPLTGHFAQLCTTGKSQLYLLGLGLMMVAAGTVLGGEEKPVSPIA